MKFNIDEAQSKASKIPHEIFLTNLVVNHILFFVSALGIAGSFPLLIAVTPIASVAALGYILIRGRSMTDNDTPWFVQCHWRIAMKRSRLLLMMLLGLALLLSAMYAIHIYGEVAFSQIFPLAAVVTMPVMITIFGLIIMESEALHFARSGQLPKSMVERFPPADDIEVLEEA
ncbi:MAG: hypothetical protein HN382_02865 [Gammaproteobacteria bacterium]|jgi:hypothetical protein|nr:hypothetical protein [Gammaproteobacteria bacterium]MBT3966283.1 hypothetical protein [Gammaproteobacteria bacterium]MBT6669302.1 hypothetical protein [Gammaproteobacteria bacterium]MBT7229828.1 hypothetical protein [Gammaproteobacteria bacterium]